MLRRRRAKESLHEFMAQAWPWIEAGRPFIDGWHLQAICEHLEAVVRGEIKNLLINIPFRLSKSTTVAVAFPAWAWVDHPELQFLFASYAQNISVRDSRRCRALIQSRWYQSRWGNRFSIVGDQDTKIRFENDHNGYRIASSVDGQNTGEGGDILVYDDPNNVKDQSEVMLESTIDWHQSVMSSRLNDFKTGRRIVIQQRVHERDLSGFILDHTPEDWVHLMLPMEFEGARKCVTVVLPSTDGVRWRDPRTKDGELICPERVGSAELKKIKRNLGSEYAVAGQLQQRPAPAEGGIIKKAWFKIWKEPEPPQLNFTLMSVDTSMTAGKTSAYNVATTWGVFNDAEKNPNVILLSMWRERCEYPELRARMQRLVRDYLDDGPHERKAKKPKRPDLILIEAKTSGLALIQDLRRAGVYTVPVNPDKRGDKISRIRLVTPIMEGGRVWLPGKPPKFDTWRDWVQPFMSEALAFPNAATRDVVDTASQALDYLQRFGYSWHPDDPAPEEKPAEFVEPGTDLFY